MHPHRISKEERHVIMKSKMTRRSFLQAGAAGGASVLAAWPALARPLTAAAQSSPGVCLTICNHWSYIGIGWQLGIESCVLSATDAMEMADRPPHVKTCINLDARAYEFMAEKFPEVAERLKKYLASGRVELIGGTYGQPMGTTISGESNIRQIVLGRDVIKRSLGYDMVTFLEEEEFTHPQIPQMVSLAGFKYASLAQLDTWGRAGCPRQDVNSLRWKGMDGTDIPCVPKNALFGYAPDLKKLAAAPEFKKLTALGKPLIFAWEEFGWESPEKPAYLTAPERYRALEQVEFVTLKEYLDKYGAQGRESVYLPMDAWNKSLTWGLGGDQIRILDRKVDALLLAAELFDAIAAAQGYPSRAEDMEKAWRDLLASQSHDVGLCEYSRWQGDRMAPFDRVEDLHNFTWGALGYNHLDAARKQGQAVLDGALDYLGSRVGAAAGRPGEEMTLVFNPHAWTRTDLASTGRIYPLPAKTRDVVVRDRSGRIVPSQLVKTNAGSDGNLDMAEVAFQAREVPSIGYDSYYLEFPPQPIPPLKTDLRFDESALTMENEFLRVRLDPKTGGLAGLTAKASGYEMLDPAQGAFPHFTGKPAPGLSTRPEPPASYDSRDSKAEIDWPAKGPLFSTVRARHSWKYLNFETHISLSAGQPYVEIVSRILAVVPPKADVVPPDIKEGYWFSFVPNFPVTSILRDFPFGVEETKNREFHALTFADLVGRDRGLLVLHMGTQYFQRDSSGRISNLAMREWESYYSHEYGWPIYAEYRHALMPHSGALDNAARIRCADAFARPLLCVRKKPQAGDRPATASFAGVSGAGIRFSSFRKKITGGYELRVVETEGRPAQAGVALHLPLQRAVQTDLLGNRLAGAPLQNGRLSVSAEPWKILTFHME
jgi:alpha-mannosidase